MSESVSTAPLLEADENGDVVRSLGVLVPRGLVHAALAGGTVIAPAGRMETAVTGLYDYARKMRDEIGEDPQGRA
jgi:hypothetical protein